MWSSNVAVWSGNVAVAKSIWNGLKQFQKTPFRQKNVVLSENLKFRAKGRIF
jgi:flagellar basal body rod protein FlgC